MHLLILGGTTEARRLAEELTGPSAPAGLRVTSSLAGRVAAPRLPAGGEVRVGGFGGPEGLARWLREHRVDALIDATHPFAETISAGAAQAARTVHVPLLVLRRPAWAPVPGDDWHRVADLPEAAATARRLGRRIFLTTGRMGLAAFAHLHDVWFLVRSVDPPEPPCPPRLEVLLDRGPFTLDGERDLLRRHAVDVLVTKDSGGAATAPKLTAAREAGIPVVLVDRPPLPPGSQVAATVEEAATWARRRS
ncbi:cobalt-precorrin-6A reductase [Streptomyces sp. ODS05-4]|uniref:cobalt-precorrin-6A reductase n=1 Tax=Streptomyces sp. ODS05-4 TaxID=2944939 RepID=UPI00210EB491|nr:cobalt-precorrin-6A reductase [Streptomyces sp. ODS05-4]